MINIHLYISFCVLIFILAFTPGPNVLLMIKYGLEYKLNEAIFPIPGIVLALLTYVIIVATGLSQCLEQFPTSYNIIRLIGAFFLIYMGLKGFYKLYKKSKILCNVEPVINNQSRLKIFTTGYLCALTNPKVLVIYLAFFPHFVDHSLKPYPQFIILGITHILFVVLSMTTYCILANRAKNYLKKYAKIQLSITNLILIGLGLFLLLEKHQNNSLF